MADGGANGGTALIIGASKGLGLGLAREHLGRGWSVIATVRDPAGAPELAAPAGDRLTVERLDVTDLEAVKALGARLPELDLLFLNAGVYGPRDVNAATAEEIGAVFLTNATGPVRAAYALAGRVKSRTGVVAFMSSQMGSIADDSSGGSDVYRASKAAQNAYARSFHVGAAAPRGITTVSLHPGWVKTDMGGSGAPLDVETSARGMADVCRAARGRGDHQFLRFNGTHLPW